MSPRVRLILGIVLLVVGAIWFLQGVSLLPGTFMRGSTLWTVIGLLLMLGGGNLVWRRAR